MRSVSYKTNQSKLMTKNSKTSSFKNTWRQVTLELFKVLFGCLRVTQGSFMFLRISGIRELNGLFVCSRSSAFFDGPRTRGLGQFPPETVSYITMNSGCLSKSLKLISEWNISGLTIHSFHCKQWVSDHLLKSFNSKAFAVHQVLTTAFPCGRRVS